MSITCKSSLRDVRIYIDNILHMIVPRPENSELGSIKLQSYKWDSLTNSYMRYCIKIDQEIYEYESEDTWKTILNLLDKHI